MIFALERDERGTFCRVQTRAGREFLIDDGDLGALENYDWRPITPNHRCQGQHTYVCRYEGRKIILLHRRLLDAPPHLQVDHRDGDGLNDRRYNIRLATKAQNTANNHYPSLGPAKSGYRGVYPSGNSRWEAAIRCSGHLRYLGTYATREEAARVWDAAAVAARGEFTQLNFS